MLSAPMMHSSNMVSKKNSKSAHLYAAMTKRYATEGVIIHFFSSMLNNHNWYFRLSMNMLYTVFQKTILHNFLQYSLGEWTVNQRCIHQKYETKMRLRKSN